ncbi:THAP domain-containing protein 2-like isoform X1 [Osmia bicornis bicornis]|uniref:THAP domain-containing protein 2-like isoform X1 n=1 Tax=Osmia bicornis bicornis TaxID=1437191 RepID=UPI001EAF7DE0|nr:THAP domain-containing protein 2-like isoform X1 [Osmia bicornis bicornis]
MSFCVVHGCKNRHSKKNIQQIELENSSEQKISFHLFPKCILRRSKWLKAIQLEKYIPTKTAAVCSAHFKEADYELNHPQRKLKKDAIPYLRKAEIRLDVPIDHQNTTSVEENINNEAEKNEVQIQEMDVKKEDVIIEEMDVTKEDDTCSYNHRMIHRSTSISPDRIMNSPTKSRIRKLYKNEITALKRKLSVSRYEQKKMQKKLVSLKNVLKDLQKRNLLRTEESDILQYLDAGTRELLFNNIRIHGGYNNNPTVKQFKSIFRNLIVHVEIKDTGTGNCIPLESIPILHTPSTRDPVTIINNIKMKLSHT